MKMYLQLFKGSDKDGRLWKSRKMRSRSFVKQFLQVMYVGMATLYPTIKDITNTNRTPSNNVTVLSCAVPGFDMCWSSGAALQSDEIGIVIGTGDNAVTVTDVALQSQITNGTGAGQMEHYGCWTYNFTSDASGGSYDIERIFVNNSGNDIIVKEVGIYAGVAISSTGIYGALEVRDVLGSPVTVSDGEHLKVKYTISMAI